MFKIPQKYLIVNFIPPFLVSLFFWVSFLIIFQLFRIIGVVINKGVDIWVFLSIIGNIALSFFPIAVPLSIFFAVYFCLNKFSEDSEIIAMRSFGMTRFDLFKPFLITGIFLSFGMLALVQNIIPNAQRQYRNSVILLTSKGMMNEIKKGEFFTDIPKVILFAEDVTDEGNHLHNVFIQTKAESSKGERIIFAEEGILKKIIPTKSFGFPEVRLLLKKGSIFEGQGDTTNTVYFDSYDYPVISGGLRYHTIYRNTMMSSAELWKRMHDEEHLDSEIDEHRKRYGEESSTFKKKYNQIMATWYSYQIEFWTRIAAPVQCLLFVFLGFSLGIKKGRGDSRNTGLIAFSMIILYYGLYFTLLGAGQKGVLPTVFVPFVPAMALGGFGLYFYRKLSWNS